MTLSQHADHFYGMIMKELTNKQPTITDYTLARDNKIGGIELKTGNYTITIIDREMLDAKPSEPTIKVEFVSGSLWISPEVRAQNLEVDSYCGKIGQPTQTIQKEKEITYFYKLPPSLNADELTKILLSISQWYIGSREMPKLPFANQESLSRK